MTCPICMCIILRIKEENHVTYFVYFIPVFGRTGKKIPHYFLNTQFSCSKMQTPCLYLHNRI